MCALISIQLNTQEEASANLWSSLCVSLFFLILSSVYFSCHNLRRLLVLSFQLGEFVRLCLNFPFLTVAWKVSQGNKQGLSKGSCYLLPIFQRLLSFIAGCTVPSQLFFHIFCPFSGGKEIWFSYCALAGTKLCLVVRLYRVWR